jgi:soluble lytic murein transglycosylase
VIKFLTAPLFALVLLVPQTQTPGTTGSSAGNDGLSPTSHAAISANAEDLWLVPSDAQMKSLRRPVFVALADGVEAFGAGEFARALALFRGNALASSELGAYAAYYKGLSQLKLSQAAEAKATFDALRARQLHGHLSVAVTLASAEVAETLGDYPTALSRYEALADDKTTVSDDVLVRVGRTALAAGDKRKAAAAFIRAYYEYPLSDAAITAGSELRSLQDVVVRRGPQADLGRAAVLFGARRYADARTAYADLVNQVNGDDREVAELRIAESDYFLGRHRASLDALTPWRDKGARRAEARFFALSALRELGRHEEYIAQTRALVADFPDSSWSEEALNNLGTHFIVQNEDESAAQVFRELYEKFPTGSRAERAAWKSGWWSYKNDEHGTAVRTFERAAKTFPRSDYRPSFLYWAARSHEKLGAPEQAEARLQLVFTDYGNSYYGRLAVKQLPKTVKTGSAAVVPASRTASREWDLATVRTIQLLLANGLYDDALDEIRFVQRTSGASPLLDATSAWAYNRKGDLRRGITLMRRAYPQFLTSAGDALPAEILQIIFPLTYWDLIRKHAAARNLDPYLVAALIAQESTFDPKIRSTANAWGLMQVVPATGRRLARSLGIRRFSTGMLTNPETNVRLGTLYFSQLVEQFGGAHFALASYNAGENRVERWKAERPGVEQDEFIDDIPFPETQNYVKRILGTAEDYRALYGKGGPGRPIPVSRVAGRAGE